MNQVTSLPSQTKLDRHLLISVVVHLTLILGFSIKAAFFPSGAIEYRSAVRVDLIGLPDKLHQIEPEGRKTAEVESEVPQKKPMPEKMEAKVEKKLPVEPEAVSFEKRTQKQKEALNRLKQMSAFDKIQEDLEKEKTGAPAKQIKGNVISAGHQLTGLAQIQADTYISEVERQIRQNWALPQWLATKNLNAQVRVTFDEKGNILSARIAKSSGNQVFDEIVVDTVHKSAPLPAPPEKFVRLMSLEGILFGFPE